MNLKYYLRGLGIGIVMTALIMGITAAGKNKPLSDSEIIERAKALGMTEESTLLADAAEDGLQEEEELLSNENEESGKEQMPEEADAAAPEATEEAAPASSATPVPTMTATPEATATPEPTTEPTAVPTPDATPAPTAKPTPSATPVPAEESTQEVEGITIQINSGDGSYTVCKKLEEAGLVDSASDFDTYLCEKGYDKRINVGTFTIPEGAEPDQIARILARVE